MIVSNKDIELAIVGLGYVGLPLAVGLCSSYKIIGFDISSERISQLLKGIDNTLEISQEKLKSCLAKNLSLTKDTKDIEQCDVFIATVPTPITLNKKPDLNPLKNVCEIISKILKKGDIFKRLVSFCVRYSADEMSITSVFLHKLSSERKITFHFSRK